jgi:hypothetical protein
MYPCRPWPCSAADGLRLDGDAALALDIHRVEHLLLHLAQRQAAGDLDQAVGQRRFAMVDMGDDGEIADESRQMACRSARDRPAGPPPDPR